MSDRKKLVVMYVEDNPDDVKLASALIGEYVDIIHVKSLSECHRSGEADVALLDLNLEGTIGVDTVKKFKAGIPHLPIVVLTHVDDPRLEAECIAAGAHAYYNKNRFDPKALIRSMEAACIAYFERQRDSEERTVHHQSLADIKKLTATILKRLESISPDD